METLIIIGIAGFVGYIAGRGMVGTKSVSVEHAEHVGMSMYQKGLEQGRREGAQTSPANASAGMVRANAAQVLAYDEYLNGYHFAMKAVREHGDDAERATEEHLLSIIQARTKASLS